MCLYTVPTNATSYRIDSSFTVAHAHNLLRFNMFNYYVVIYYKYVTSEWYCFETQLYAMKWKLNMSMKMNNVYEYFTLGYELLVWMSFNNKRCFVYVERRNSMLGADVNSVYVD